MKTSPRGQLSTTARTSPAHDDCVQTPDWLADIMVDWLDLQDGMTVLDPCYGEGALVRALLRSGKELHVVGCERLGKSTVNQLHAEKVKLLLEHPHLGHRANEERMEAIQAINQQIVAVKAQLVKIERAEADFPDNVTAHRPVSFLCEIRDRRFDRAILNPPFSNCGAFEFVKTICEGWLKPGGKAVCVIPGYIVDNSEGRKPWLSKWMRRTAVIPKGTFTPEVPVLHGGIGLFHQGDGCSFEFIGMDGQKQRSIQ